MKKYLEIEFKYKADLIRLSDFTGLFERQTNTFVMASGHDHFYTKGSSPDSFFRHRVGPDTNQLTFKKKTNDKNNFIRDEDNLDLLPNVPMSQVASICGKSGYEFKRSIFKNCFIYKYDKHTFVYYVCYDTNLNELGRFLEIEVSESYPWKSEQEAWNYLTYLEQSFEPFGVSSKSRMKRSLFELYIQD